MTAQLKVQAKTRLNKDESKAFAFTVSSQPYEAPALVRQAQGEWTKLGGQVLSGFSLWRYPVAWILLILGWGFASWMANWPFFMWGGNFNGLADWLRFSVNVMDPWALWISSAIYGAIYGLLVGLITWLALRIAEPTLPFLQLPVLMFGWMIGWAIGLVGLIGPLPFGISPRTYALFAGLIGGIFTASACRNMQPKPGLGRAFIIFLAWPLGQIVVNSLLRTGIDVGAFYFSTHFDLTGAISSFIAGGLTLLMLGIPRKD